MSTIRIRRPLPLGSMEPGAVLYSEPIAAGTVVTQEMINRMAMKAVENLAVLDRMVFKASLPKPARLDRIRWAVSDYFHNLWNAILGRSFDD